MRTSHPDGRPAARAAGRFTGRACMPQCWQATAPIRNGCGGQRLGRTLMSQRRTTATQAASLPLGLYQDDPYLQVTGHSFEEDGGLQPATVEVRLSIQQEVTWGQVVGVVGSSHELGAWHCDGAVRLAWSEGHNWSTVLHLPAGTRLSYKYVILGGDHGPVWQEGPNLLLEATSPGGLLEVADVWDREAATRTIHTTGQSPAPSQSGSHVPSRCSSPWPPEQPTRRSGSLQGPEEMYAAARNTAASPEPGRSSPLPDDMPGIGFADSNKGSSSSSSIHGHGHLDVIQQQDAQRGPSPQPEAGKASTPQVEVLGRGGRSGRRRSWLAGPDTEQLLAEGLAALRSLQQQQQDTLAALQAPLPSAPWMDVLQGLSSGTPSGTSSLPSPLGAVSGAGWAPWQAPWQAPLPLYGRASPSPSPPPAAAAMEDQQRLHSSAADAWTQPVPAPGAAVDSMITEGVGADAAVAAEEAEAGAASRQAAPSSGRQSPLLALASHDDIAAALCSDDYEDACHALADVLGSCSEEGAWPHADNIMPPPPMATAPAAVAPAAAPVRAAAVDSNDDPGLQEASSQGAPEAVPQVMVTGNAAVSAATAMASAGGLSLGLPKAVARKAALKGVETALREAWEVVREEPDPGAPRVLEADRGLAAATTAMDRLLNA